MDENAPFFHPGFDLAPRYAEHQGGPSALAWATFALLLLLSLAFFAVALSQFTRRPRKVAVAGGPDASRDPLDLLRSRYARGELSRDEFLQANADLTADRQEQQQPPSPDQIGRASCRERGWMSVGAVCARTK